jgi:protein required for attachment to host cells
MSLADKLYDKLVLVAPPATLGDLREALAKGVRACVTAEIAQDLVKIPASQLQSHLVGVLPLKAPRARTQARARAAK